MVIIHPGVMLLPVFCKDPSLTPFLFFYINDLWEHLSDDLWCNPKLFGDDTSLFATMDNINKARNDLNNDLTKIRKWAF